MMESPTAEICPATGTTGLEAVEDVVEAPGDEVEPGGDEAESADAEPVGVGLARVETVVGPPLRADCEVADRDVAGVVTAGEAEWAWSERCASASANSPTSTARSATAMIRSIRLILLIITSLACSGR